MRRVELLVCLAIAVAASGCHRRAREAGPAPSRAFYFWRTTLALTPAEQHALVEHRVTRLYVRAFDIDDAGALVGPLTVPTGAAATLPPDLEIVPVVFLRQALFRHPPGDLAARVAQAVVERMTPFGAAIHEVQLDCDWTDRTHDAYFAFLRDLHTRMPGVVQSATIRLHQVKYRERTGVPPVERGMLMFYNMGELGAAPGAHAIFDPESAAKYLGRLGEYPLPLDVALPLWSWTVHVRDGVIVGLMQSTDPSELPALDFLVRAPGGGGGFTVTRTTFLHGEMLREGDALQPELTTSADTLAAAALVAPSLPAATRTLALFDLSERNLARHDSHSLDQIFQSVR